MSDDNRLCSVKVQPRPSPPIEGLYRDQEYEVFMRAEITGRIQRAWINREELKEWKDALDDLSDEKMEAFVWERAGRFVRIIERTGKEDRPCDERGAIELKAADLTGLCPDGAAEGTA